MATEATKGGYRFIWDAEDEAACQAMINGQLHGLFTLQLTEGSNSDTVVVGSEPQIIKTWCILVPRGKYRAVELPSIGLNADKDVVMLQAILAYKELGFGEGIPW